MQWKPEKQQSWCAAVAGRPCCAVWACSLTPARLAQVTNASLWRSGGLVWGCGVEMEVRLALKTALKQGEFDTFERFLKTKQQEPRVVLMCLRELLACATHILDFVEGIHDFGDRDNLNGKGIEFFNKRFEGLEGSMEIILSAGVDQSYDEMQGEISSTPAARQVTNTPSDRSKQRKLTSRLLNGRCA